MSIYKNDFSDELIEIYKMGHFPMADNVDEQEIYIISPEKRGLLSINDIHISRSLRKTLRKYPFKVTLDKDFEQVIRSCAEISNKRKESWINETIIKSFISLHRKGHAHSIEIWDGNDLVGGLYGLEIGGVFCGESMFSKATNTSKIALIHLCARLWRAGFKILDCQFTNDHLEQFGCFEVDASKYKSMLDLAKEEKTNFLLENDKLENDEYKLLCTYLDWRNNTGHLLGV